MPMEGSSSHFNTLLLAFLQAALSLPHTLFRDQNLGTNFMLRISGPTALTSSFLELPSHFAAAITGSEPMVLQARNTADFLAEF